MIDFAEKISAEAEGCAMGILIMENVNNLSTHQTLDELKQNLEAELRQQYGQKTRQELKALHPMDIYVAYYKKYGYNYHVLLQLESILVGKSIPAISPLVEAMFMAELKNMLLTAGHDLEKIAGALTFTASSGEEIYTGMNKKLVPTIKDDYMMKDEQSVISSILRGPDGRTSIDEHTKRVLFTVYAPAGIENELILQHLSDIEKYVRTFSADAQTALMKTL